MDSQEVDYILSSCGVDDWVGHAGSLFVLVGDGEYVEIWASKSSVPCALVYN